jgi:hypothetical protein
MDEKVSVGRRDGNTRPLRGGQTQKTTQLRSSVVQRREREMIARTGSGVEHDRRPPRIFRMRCDEGCANVGNVPAWNLPNPGSCKTPG